MCVLDTRVDVEDSQDVEVRFFGASSSSVANSQIDS